jgi:flagellar biosynthesis protein FlhG
MITEGITQNLDFKNSIYKGPGNIDILPVNSALRETTNRKDGQLLKKITPAFSKYEHEYDKVIVDAGTGISGDVLSFVLGADRVILLTTSDPTSIADVYGMIKIISRHDEKKPIFLVLNMINGDVDGRTLYNKMKLMVQKFLNIEINFGGIVHNDVVAARLVQDRHMTILDYPNTIAAEELNISVRQMINTPSVNVPKANGYFNRVISNRNNLSIS